MTSPFSELRNAISLIFDFLESSDVKVSDFAFLWSFPRQHLLDSDRFPKKDCLFERDYASARESFLCRRPLLSTPNERREPGLSFKLLRSGGGHP